MQVQWTEYFQVINVCQLVAPKVTPLTNKKAYDYLNSFVCSYFQLL